MTQNNLFQKPQINIANPDLYKNNDKLALSLIVEELRGRLYNDFNLRNEMKFCPVCNSRIEDRKVSIYEELITDLYRVYVWCGKRKANTFEMKDIREKISKNNYARFGDLVRFGGLVYKFKDENGKKIKAKYGLNMGRCKEFFRGDRKIPVQITLNQITNEIIDSKYVSVKEIPSLCQYIDQKGLYDYEKTV